MIALVVGEVVAGLVLAWDVRRGAADMESDGLAQQMTRENQSACGFKGTHVSRPPTMCCLFSCDSDFRTSGMSLFLAEGGCDDLTMSEKIKHFSARLGFAPPTYPSRCRIDEDPWCMYLLLNG